MKNLLRQNLLLNNLSWKKLYFLGILLTLSSCSGNLFSSLSSRGYRHSRVTKDERNFVQKLFDGDYFEKDANKIREKDIQEYNMKYAQYEDYRLLNQKEYTSNHYLTPINSIVANPGNQNNSQASYYKTENSNPIIPTNFNYEENFTNIQGRPINNLQAGYRASKNNLPKLKNNPHYSVSNLQSYHNTHNTHNFNTANYNEHTNQNVQHPYSQSVNESTNNQSINSISPYSYYKNNDAAYYQTLSGYVVDVAPYVANPQKASHNVYGSLFGIKQPSSEDYLLGNDRLGGNWMGGYGEGSTPGCYNGFGGNSLC